MANLPSDSCLQTSWNTNQSKNHSISAQNSKKSGNNKCTSKRVSKKATKNNITVDDYEEEQDNLGACFKDSDFGKTPQLNTHTLHECIVTVTIGLELKIALLSR